MNLRKHLSGKELTLVSCLVALFGLALQARSVPTVSTDGYPVPSSFFGMHVVRSLERDWPTVPFGALGKKGGTAWRDLQPSPGEYNWRGLDRYVSAAQSHGVLAMYTFGQTPQWASSEPRAKCLHGPIGCAAPPARIEDWKSHISAVVARYKGRIRFYELWNEPNDPNRWSGSYADMLKLAKEAYTVIKSIDPNAIVLTPGPAAGRKGAHLPMRGMTSHIQATWMDEYLRAGGSSYADGLSFHAYPIYDTCSDTLDCAGASLAAQVDRVRAIADRNGMQGKPLYVTEGGWRRPAELSDPDQQVAYVARWFIILASKGVAGAYWYSWEGPWGTLWDPEAGLLSPGKAYEQVYHWLVGATIVPCTVAKDVWSCPIRRDKGYQALAIWSTSGNQSYTPPKEYKQYRDLAGGTSVIKGPIPVGIKPILVETSSPPH